MNTSQILDFNIINQALCSPEDKVKKVLKKSEKAKGLSHQDVAILLNADDSLSDLIFDTANKVNVQLYKKVITFYGVSYLSDECINVCSYCGDNVHSKRNKRTLSLEEFKKDLESLLNKHNFKQVCFLTGEHPNTSPDKLTEYLKLASEMYHETIIINVPPMSVNDFRKIRDAIPNRLHFRVFQESYDKSIYKIHHRSGPKSDFDWRVESQERALLAGFNEVGLGVLFGLNNREFGAQYEILALKTHSDYLYSKFVQYPASISFPRIRKSIGIDFENPIIINDDDFIKYIAIVRLAIPQTQLIITCRENAEFRRRVRPIINIEDFGAKPGPGGNYRTDVDFQMELEDRRSGEEVKEEIIKEGFKVQ
jgi:2-iminoacetate synthase